MTSNEQIDQAIETLIADRLGKQCLKTLMTMHYQHMSSSGTKYWKAIETIAQAMSSSPDLQLAFDIEDRLKDSTDR